MGNPPTDEALAASKTLSSSVLGETSSAIALHNTAASAGAAPPPAASTGRYFDDPTLDEHDDELPPLYSEHAEYNDDASLGPVDPLVPRGNDLRVQPFGHDGDGTTAYYIDSRLDSDPAFLFDHVQRLAAIPPRPFVRLRGTHRERRRRSGDKDRSGSDEVVDFDVRVELTHLLYTDIRQQQSWRELVAAGNLEKVRRGTVVPKRAPGFGGRGSAAEEGTPDVEQWCHRFCASPAGLKCFTLERRVVGWDWDLVRRRLEALVRATNYRGRAVVSFPVRNARVDVYNECRTNRWRLTGWVCFLFYATLLFLLSWPWLKLRTLRWETVAAEWHASQPTSVPGRPRRPARPGRPREGARRRRGSERRGRRARGRVEGGRRGHGRGESVLWLGRRPVLSVERGVESDFWNHGRRGRGVGRDWSGVCIAVLGWISMARVDF
ncbi:hypothetical protein HIM_06645 [Hirsutella minnesotensis 3608]|uniref:Uncharacterized protein n=1 Tax=Hirsutella minnesotensis 3608 TaxID=1043627 RepID=A0A0F7ZZC4_9HYPO|nr:hypothetical protein HIM_06645 [Hirsutella minnesotensis 3608]